MRSFTTLFECFIKIPEEMKRATTKYKNEINCWNWFYGQNEEWTRRKTETKLFEKIGCYNRDFSDSV